MKRAFHGCSVLQVGATGMEEEEKELLNPHFLLPPLSMLRVVETATSPPQES